MRVFHVPRGQTFMLAGSSVLPCQALVAFQPAIERPLTRQNNMKIKSSAVIGLIFLILRFSLATKTWISQ